MSSEDKIKQTFETSGIKYQMSDGIFISYWGPVKQERIKVLVFPSDDEKWVNLVVLIGKISELTHDSGDLIYFLRENSRKIGIKYSIDKNDNLRCGIEIPIECLHSELLKEYFIRIIKSVRNFYKHIDKKKT